MENSPANPPSREQPPTDSLETILQQLLEGQKRQEKIQEQQALQIGALQAAVRETVATPLSTSQPSTVSVSAPSELATEAKPPATAPYIGPQQRPRRRLKDPKPFSGKKSEWKSFRLEAENVLATDGEAIGDATDQLRTIYAWLEGKPKNSSTSYVSATIQKGVPDPVAFLNRLEAVYGERDRRQKALKALREIRQGDNETFAAFYPRFEAELNDAGSELWTEDTKINYLQGALNEALKSRLVMFDDTNVYIDFARQCEKISSKMELLGQWKNKDKDEGRKHRGGRDTPKRGSESSGPVAREDMMEWEPTEPAVTVSAARPGNINGYPSKRPEDMELLGKRAKWVTADEIHSRREEGRCLRCGRSGCRIATCPLAAPIPPRERSKRHHVQANRAAAEDVSDSSSESEGQGKE
jgi:hypothetical protein